MWWFILTVMLSTAAMKAERYDCELDEKPVESCSQNRKRPNEPEVRKCSTPFADMPVIRCPENYKIIKCTLQTETKFDNGLMNQPETGDCSTPSPCSFCKLTVHCKSLLPPPTPAPTPDPCEGVADQTTCRGESYSYVEYKEKACSVGSVTVIKKISERECQRYCDAQCDCLSFTWAGEVFPADPPECHIHNIKCAPEYLQPLTEVLYSYDDRSGGYFVKNVTTPTCDGETYTYHEMVGKKYSFYHSSVYLDSLSLAQCQAKCNEDCQCTSIQHDTTTSSTCQLLFLKINENTMSPQTGTRKLFVKQLAGSGPPVLTGTCGGLNYGYMKIEKRDGDSYQSRLANYAVQSVNECEVKCSEYCECKSFTIHLVASGGFNCELYFTVARDEILTLSPHVDYYIKQGPGDCPPNITGNCNDQTYTFSSERSKTCDNSYNLERVGSSFMMNRMQCEKICVSRCDCEGYLFGVFQYEQTDYSCVIKGPGCVDNLVNNPNSFYEDDYTSYSESFYKKVLVP